MKLKEGLLGSGSWGTTVASLVARNAPAVLFGKKGGRFGLLDG